MKHRFAIPALLCLSLLLAACAPEGVGASPTSQIIPDTSTGDATPVQTATPTPVQITPNATAQLTEMPGELTVPPAETAAPGTQTASPTPGDSTRTITLQNSGETLTLHVGDRFLLQLGETYNWQIIIANQSVLSRVKNIAVVRGAQGIYEALHKGQTEFAAQGDAACRSQKPACALPSVMFRLTVVVE